MSFFKKIRYSFHIMEPIYPLCGGICAVVFGAVTLVSSACHPMYLFLLLPRNALPYWLFACMGLLIFFLLGVGGGLILAIPGCKKRCWKPLFLYVAAIILMLIWYHVLFRSLNIIVAFLLLMCALILEIIAAINTAGDNPLATLVTIFVILISLHFAWLNIGLMFLN